MDDLISADMSSQEHPAGEVLFSDDASDPAGYHLVVVPEVDDVNEGWRSQMPILVAMTDWGAMGDCSFYLQLDII